MKNPTGKLVNGKLVNEENNVIVRKSSSEFSATNSTAGSTNTDFEYANYISEGYDSGTDANENYWFYDQDPKTPGKFAYRKSNDNQNTLKYDIENLQKNIEKLQIQNANYFLLIVVFSILCFVMLIITNLSKLRNLFFCFYQNKENEPDLKIHDHKAKEYQTRIKLAKIFEKLNRFTKNHLINEQSQLTPQLLANFFHDHYRYTQKLLVEEKKYFLDNNQFPRVLSRHFIVNTIDQTYTGTEESFISRSRPPMPPSETDISSSKSKASNIQATELQNILKELENENFINERQYANV